MNFKIDHPHAILDDFLVMKKSYLFLIPLLSLTAHAADPVVNLAAVQAIFDDGGEAFDGFKTFNSEAGHHVALIVRAGDQSIVDFDDDKAKLSIGGVDAKCRFFGGNAFSKDKKTMRLEFNTKSAAKVSPNGSMKVIGVLPLVLATGKQETRSEVFTISNDVPVVYPAGKTDLPKFKVKSTGKPQWGDDPFQIEFSIDRKPDEMAGVRFYTKEGKEVEADRTSSGWMGFGSKGSGEVTYSFKAVHKELMLAVETWTGREEVEIKVDLEAGLSAR